MSEALLEDIRRLAEPILTSRQAELVELTSHRQGRHLLLRLLVDKVGGITIRDCAVLNEQISQALDGAGWLTERYTLEVSSPGLDRPLASKRDFERALGEAVELEFKETFRGRKGMTGAILAVQEAALVLHTEEGNVTIPLEQVQWARKVIRWS